MASAQWRRLFQLFFVLSIHGNGRRQRLPVSLGILMDALMARLGLTVALCDVADGVWLQCASDYGNTSDAIAGIAAADNASHSFFSVFSQTKCISVYDLGIVHCSAPVVLFSLYLFSFVAAILTAALFKGQFPNKEPFVLELPPYRFPTIKQMLISSWCQSRKFLLWSRRFIILG
jgi:hypothetical protein